MSHKANNTVEPEKIKHVELQHGNRIADMLFQNKPIETRAQTVQVFVTQLLKGATLRNGSVVATAPRPMNSTTPNSWVSELSHKCFEEGELLRVEGTWYSEAVLYPCHFLRFLNWLSFFSVSYLMICMLRSSSAKWIEQNECHRSLGIYRSLGIWKHFFVVVYWKVERSRPSSSVLLKPESQSATSQLPPTTLFCLDSILVRTRMGLPDPLSQKLFRSWKRTLFQCLGIFSPLRSEYWHWIQYLFEWFQFRVARW